jgi:hypothetical protein
MHLSVLFNGLLKVLAKKNMCLKQPDLVIMLHTQSLHSLSDGLPQRLFHDLVRVWITLLLQQNTQIHVMEMRVYYV